MYVTIETNSWCDNDGAYLFNTFKEAFDYLSSRFNSVFEDWQEDRMKKYTNMNRPLTDEDRKYYEDTGSMDALAFYCTDSNIDKNELWSNGIYLSLYEIKNKG